MSGGLLLTGIEPNLIHAVDMEIQRLDLATTVYDPIFREPVAQSGPTYAAAEAVVAQIHWHALENQGTTQAGDDDVTDGWITMLKSEVDELVGGPFKRGDKIVTVDGKDFSADPLFIVEPFRAGHYATAKLYKFYFVKRDKSIGTAKANKVR